MARGQPDEEVYQPRISPEDLPRKLTPRADAADFGAPIASGIEHLGETLQQKYQADSATWAGDQIANARVNAIAKLQQMKESLPAGDPGNFTQKYLQQFDKDNQSLVEATGSNPVARDMVHKGLTQLRENLADHTIEWEATQRKASQNDSIQQNLDKQLGIARAHPEMANDIGQTLMQQINASSNDPATKLKFGRQIDEQLTRSAALGLIDQNPSEAYKQLKSESPSNPILAQVTDPKMREELTQKAAAGVAKGVGDSVVDVYRAQGPVAGGKAYAAASKLDLPDEIKRGVYEKIETGLAQYHKQARDENSGAIESLEEKLAAGKTELGDRAAVWDLYHKGAFTAEQTGETIGRIEKAQEKQVEDTTNRDFVADAYKSGRAIDPQDKNVKDGMATLFTEQTQGVQPGSPEWINRGADMASKTGVTPEPVISWARAKLIGGDPQSAAQAAQSIARQQDANPRGIGYALDERTKSMARLINDAVDAGTDQKTAVENARKITSMPDAERNRLEEVYKQQKVGQGAVGALSAELKGDPKFQTGFFIHSSLTPPPEMVGQFEQQRQNYFKLTGGNVKQANDLAFADMKNTWGVTQVNGKKEYMEFAPEQMNPGLTKDYLRQDMEASAKGHTADPSSVHLVATPETYHSQGQRWALGVPDKFGAYDVIRDARGNPLSYQLPTAMASADQTRAKANEAGMSQLHDMQHAAKESEKALYESMEAEQEQREKFGNMVFK
jgi:hypothetical protein